MDRLYHIKITTQKLTNIYLKKCQRQKHCLVKKKCTSTSSPSSKQDGSAVCLCQVSTDYLCDEKHATMQAGRRYGLQIEVLINGNGVSYG